MSKWDEPEFAKDYMNGASDTTVNWYEYEVNAPALWSLIPTTAKTVLDYGCGPGEFTAKLIEHGYDVEGSDASPAMIVLAQKNETSFTSFVWDGKSPFPGNKKYDVVTSKLTLHFVQDLNLLAREFHEITNDGGSVVISVPHPLSTLPKAHGEYFNQVAYDTEIGGYNIFITMIHRSVQDYIRPFLHNGLMLTDILEPSISSDLIKKYDVSDEYARIPRRLLLKFIRVAS